MGQNAGTRTLQTAGKPLACVTLRLPSSPAHSLHFILPPERSVIRGPGSLVVEHGRLKPLA